MACAALALAGIAAHAHKSSDSYLQIDATDKGLAVRWDIALRDLDAALDLDTDEDGKLTWAEVKAAWPRVQAYAMARLQIDSCALRPVRQALERRNDGAYAVMFLASDCVLAKTPQIAYTLLREVDPTHRGIAKVQRTGQPMALSLLDPTRPAVVDPALVPAPAPAPAPASALAAEPVASVQPPTTASASRRMSPGPGSSQTATAAAEPALSGAAGWGFLREGMRHILTGYDHVLFLLCLLLPSVMRRTPEGWRPVERLSQAVLPVVGIVSAFTVAHSITLALAATKVVSLSPAFIEPAIAVTIILAALDNVWPIFPVRRVVVTFFFGLIHGFGFASVLAELNLPTAEFAWALLEFNVGLELGQLLIVVSVTAALFLLRQRPRYPSWVIRGGSYAAIVVGGLWLIERTANVSIIPMGS
jgi:hypothetical protein